MTNQTKRAMIVYIERVVKNSGETPRLHKCKNVIRVGLAASPDHLTGLAMGKTIPCLAALVNIFFRKKIVKKKKQLVYEMVL